MSFYVDSAELMGFEKCSGSGSIHRSGWVSLMLDRFGRAPHGSAVGFQEAE